MPFLPPNQQRQSTEGTSTEGTLSVWSEVQHGFVKNRSRLTNLLVFMEVVTNYLDLGTLSGRKHRVMLGGQVSDWNEVLSGVPQGSILGPILFVLYIDDIDECINSKTLKFADDTKIYRTVYSLEAIDSLHADLHNLVLWRYIKVLSDHI